MNDLPEKLLVIYDDPLADMPEAVPATTEPLTQAEIDEMSVKPGRVERGKTHVRSGITKNHSRKCPKSRRQMALKSRRLNRQRG